MMKVKKGKPKGTPPPFAAAAASPRFGTRRKEGGGRQLSWMRVRLVEKWRSAPSPVTEGAGGGGKAAGKMAAYRDVRAVSTAEWWCCTSLCCSCADGWQRLSPGLSLSPSKRSPVAFVIFSTLSCTLPTCLPRATTLSARTSCGVSFGASPQTTRAPRKRAALLVKHWTMVCRVPSKNHSAAAHFSKRSCARRRFSCFAAGGGGGGAFLSACPVAMRLLEFTALGGHGVLVATGMANG